MYNELDLGILGRHITPRCFRELQPDFTAFCVSEKRSEEETPSSVNHLIFISTGLPEVPYSEEIPGNTTENFIV